MELTKSQEEYIKAIYILHNMIGAVRVTDIAIKLGISKPSVTRSVKNLAILGVVCYKAYGDITLTELGTLIARQIITRQDTLKNFLYEILDVDEKVAEYEATEMKHYLSKETQEKLQDHVNKLLDLGGTSCNCNENSEKCKQCIKYKIKNRLTNRRKEC